MMHWSLVFLGSAMLTRPAAAANVPYYDGLTRGQGYNTLLGKGLKHGSVSFRRKKAKREEPEPEPEPEESLDDTADTAEEDERMTFEFTAPKPDFSGLDKWSYFVPLDTAAIAQAVSRLGLERVAAGQNTTDLADSRDAVGAEQNTTGLVPYRGGAGTGPKTAVLLPYRHGAGAGWNSTTGLAAGRRNSTTGLLAGGRNATRLLAGGRSEPRAGRTSRAADRPRCDGAFKAEWSYAEDYA
ncbi:hypothetical protein CDD83_3178 [Cordyceps sp. RAO-2017]|nr:hypothetical protein CDD83_3178 [Cordyceps sp. RAO-2017]